MKRSNYMAMVRRVRAKRADRAWWKRRFKRSPKRQPGECKVLYDRDKQIGTVPPNLRR